MMLSLQDLSFCGEEKARGMPGEAVWDCCRVLLEVRLPSVSSLQLLRPPWNDVEDAKELMWRIEVAVDE